MHCATHGGGGQRARAQAAVALAGHAAVKDTLGWAFIWSQQRPRPQSTPIPAPGHARRPTSSTRLLCPPSHRPSSAAPQAHGVPLGAFDEERQLPAGAAGCEIDQCQAQHAPVCTGWRRRGKALRDPREEHGRCRALQRTASSAVPRLSQGHLAGKRATAAASPAPTAEAASRRPHCAAVLACVPCALPPRHHHLAQKAEGTPATAAREGRGCAHKVACGQVTRQAGTARIELQQKHEHASQLPAPLCLGIQPLTAGREPRTAACIFHSVHSPCKELPITGCLPTVHSHRPLACDAAIWQQRQVCRAFQLHYMLALLCRRSIQLSYHASMHGWRAGRSSQRLCSRLLLCHLSFLCNPAVACSE